MKRNSQQGVALVITLVLLSVITFMAVTFLVVSRSERQAVTTQSDQTDARLAADTARERAIADMIVPIMAFSNANAFQMRVSTNFVNRLGFDVTLPANGNRYTNVNYDHKTGGGLLNAGELEQNIANLAYDPRPPVFIRTNGAPAGVSDFRYYLDLNRNGRFDPTGFLPATNNANQPLVVGGIPVTNNFVGDPEWVGVLERPEFPHSATNKFTQRFAYLVLPTGAALDLNYVHNQTLSDALSPRADGYQRNQGFGSWEINLAAFLRDLNTNFWTYNYNRPIPPFAANVGTAFEDAFSFLRYRYANNLNNLSTIQALFPAAAIAFTRDSIDGYADGPLMTDVFGLRLTPDDTTRRRWPGSDNPQHFFNTQDFFDVNKVSAPFVNRLRTAGTNNSSYNRYTYYRLLSQLATDSASEPAGKMNLNYDNLVRANVAGVTSATNFYNWEPIDFFNNAANRLLQSATNLGIFNLTVTNIPVYPTNYYTPAVHRLLQLAANMYDATTNRNLPGTGFPYVPSVFRPRFGVNGTNIFISGYVEESPEIRPLADFLTSPVRHLNFPDDRAALASRPDDLVYGVPLVIGAKEGFPNFNEYSMQSFVQVTRKLELRRRNAFSRPNETNQMYLIGISNVFAVEAWNSYTNPFPRNLDLYVTNQLSIVLTNENGVIRSTNLTLRQIIPINIPANTWQGLVSPQVPQQSFRIPIFTNVIFLSNSVYSASQPYFRPLNSRFEQGIGFPVPQWGLSITNNRLRYILVDRATQRVVDYVHLATVDTNLASLDVNLDITRELMGNFNVQNEASATGQQWLTNRPQNSTSIFTPTYGVINQIEVSLGNQDIGDWINYSLDPISGNDKPKAIAGFRAFFYATAGNSNLIQQAPFTPSRKIYQNISWQANDPLVHYTLNDLTDLARTNDINFISPPNNPAPVMPNLSKINTRYQPWGGNPNLTPDETARNLALKDPLVNRSDDWDFPTNKLPNLGWLGRVHRGTPWQTIYLKSALVNEGTWAKWTGNAFDPERSVPSQDRNLLDLFTVAPNDNASRGQMSINQTDLPGWSAILSGVIVLTNSATDKELQENPLAAKFDPLVIEPAGVDGANSQLFRIVAALNRDRANTNANPDQTFHRLGDILATPELTVASPYLNVTNSTQLERGVSDPVYERIPQQVLSLLKVGEPRFVIYSYGQSLKPADRSIVQSGPFIGMSTNYQITGETATRTVVRIDGAPNNPRAVIESFNVLPPD